MQAANPEIPVRNSLRTALLLAFLFAALTFIIHLASSLWGAHLGYGYFRDELYFLICGRRLAWGYVDQPPMVALQARLAEMLFGLSPTGIRILSFAAGGGTVGLTGLLAWQLGGRRWEQILAMTAVLAAPVFLATANFLSMNSFEPCFWMASLLVLLRLADGSAGPRAWLLYGLLAGLGIENKHSTVFFLVAMLAGLLLSPERRILRSRWFAAALALLILLALPNFLWQWANHFPTYEFLNRVAHSDKVVRLSALEFLWLQVDLLLFSTAPLWIGGLVWLGFARRARQWRFVAFAYMVFLVMMMALHAKHYYLAPMYPVLFAAGAVALGTLTPSKRPAIIYTVVLGLTLIFATGPLVLTILPPDRYNVYTKYFPLKGADAEKFSGPLPQVLSDRFGWQQMVEGFAARYNALPAEERARTGIICTNYGETSAVNVLGPKYGLPTAISGHQNYYFWGWNGYTGASMLTLGDNRADYAKDYDEVVDLGPFDAPWTMDREHRHFFWLRHRKRPYVTDWPELKNWY